ncbi:uracil-DNA glycosylase [Celeribacter baekdonensis]|uniref:Type-4 uracil-DNA glycosylase n=1 Tax=Celeribacter baekdonensis TaxID=875171 RepID=A0A2R4M6K8_9RHOB|nr:uracil-DNA glycosylase [Celeribacter baekdonensis]AVW92844.1 uracil-DNA glycosylase [Celeribacter baekdonensis]
METQIDYWQAHALLEWQIELGATEAIAETPVNRYEVAAAASTSAPDAPVAARSPAPPVVAAAKEVDPVEAAMALAKSVTSLDALREAMAGFDLCDLKRGARNLVFSDGNPKARVMIIGEAPGREEDQQGKPFVGRSGQLLDKMFAAIGMDRSSPDAEHALYITNPIPWRPPENRDPTPAEIAMLKPFLIRHIELADPDVIVLMGNWACTALLGRAGITRLRGTWQTVLGKPAMPMTHPAYLLRTPVAKREAWADLLDIQARLRSLT